MKGVLGGRLKIFLSISQLKRGPISYKLCSQRFAPQTTYTVVIVVIIPAATIAERYTVAITEHIIIITFTALCALFCLLTKGRGKNVIAC